MKKSLVVGIQAAVAGSYRLRTGKNLGYIDANSGLWLPGREIITRELEFDNIITNNGMDHIGERSDWWQFCHVGTGTATELVTDTALGSFVAGQVYDADIAKSYKTVQGGSPYYGKMIRHYRFDPGEATGNIAEVGISPQGTTGDLFSRARVKDGGGSPTTITVLADEYLDVDYSYRQYPAYVSGDLDSIVSGEDFILRGSMVTTYNNMAIGCGNVAGYMAVGTTVATAYSDDAALGAVTGQPSATSSSNIEAADASNANYSGADYYRDITYTWGLDDANFGAGNGIKAIRFNTQMGSYQLLFDTEQPKTNIDIAELNVRLSWARATIP